MIRQYAAMGLQLLGLIVTGEALLLYFGEMGPLMKTASIGAGLFYAGRFIRPRSVGEPAVSKEAEGVPKRSGRWARR